MKLKLKTNRWGCQLWSLAMVLDADPELMIPYLGFDPSAKVSEAKEPYCYRGVSDSEIITLALRLNVYMVPIIKESVHPSGMVVKNEKLFESYIRGHKPGCLLLREGHTVACDGKHVYCPDLGIKELATGDWDAALLPFNVTGNRLLEEIRIKN